MTSDQQAKEAKHDWALDKIRDRVEAEPDGHQDATSNLWTGIKHIKADGSGSDLVERDEVRGLVDELVEGGEVLSWHGLLAPADEEHLRAIIENETQTESPRKMLIKRVNQFLASDPT